MTEDRRRTLDERFEVQAFLAGGRAVVEVAVAEAVGVETALEKVEVSSLGAGMVARAVKDDPVMEFLRKTSLQFGALIIAQ